MTNPWERNAIVRSLSHLSISGSDAPATRPMSVSLWDANWRNKENMYVDEPAGGSTQSIKSSVKSLPKHK